MSEDRDFSSEIRNPVISTKCDSANKELLEKARKTLPSCDFRITQHQQGSRLRASRHQSLFLQDEPPAAPAES